MSEPFASYACSLGTVIGYEVGHYIIATHDGRTIGIPAAATPSAADVEADIATPAPRRLTGPEVIDLAQRTMDAWAQEWGYDHIARACTYVGDPHDRFNAEGTALRNARSAVWAYLDSQEDTLETQLPTEGAVLALLATLKPARPQPPYA